MPGIVVFRRRWSVGSDDFVVAAVFLVILHAVWIIVLGTILGVMDFSGGEICLTDLWIHVIGYVAILSVCIVLEGIAAWVSMRGSILNTEPRSSMQYLLYIRLVILFVELAWLVVGIVWVSEHYKECQDHTSMKAIIGIMVCNWAVLLCVLLSVCCTFDTAGRSWVKMKRYQESIKKRETKAINKRCSGSRRRNWRHRKAMRAYEQSWDRRCNMLFCCVRKDRNRNSFSEIAKLFTEFFRDLDVVPSDIVAGLVLMRQHQKLRRKLVVSQGTNDVYQFLSGVPVTPASKFLSLKSEESLKEYQKVVHYMRYALAAYGWPMYMMMETGTGLCKIMPNLSCCCCCLCQEKNPSTVDLIDDNCCECNFAALRQLSGLNKADLIYVTYHVDIGQTPFFVAVDHEMRTDVLTDLKADCEQLPVNPQREDWLGHKGMVHAAIYIKKKLKDEMLLSRAFSVDPDRGTQSYELVIVGHSLGAGTAAILAILLRQEYPNLMCYAYSPPGGLLSAPCVEDTKSFITSVVLGKDVVSRIGLHQLEAMRNDLINVIKKATDPKWKIIMSTILCCSSEDRGLRETVNGGAQMEMYELMKQEKEERYFLHPSDSEIALTSHTPLFPPGKIIHIVRNHPKNSGKLCSRSEPVYQAIWADNTDFDEVLISPTMINDHMPEEVMDALQKVLTNISPAKPSRKLKGADRQTLLHTPPSPVQEEETCNYYNATYAECPPNSLAVAEPNSMSWDYGDMIVGSVARRPQRHPRLNHPIFRQSFPPPASDTRPKTLDLARDDWLGLAPLASPETLSETSSMDSMRSKRSSTGYQKLTSSVPRLAAIKQSPLRPTRSDGFANYPKKSSPKHSLSLTPIPTNGHSSPERVCVSPGSPIAQSTPFDALKSESVDQKLEKDDEKTAVAELFASNGDQSDLGCSPLEDSAEQNVTDLSTVEERIQSKMDDIQAKEPYKLAFANESCCISEDRSDEFISHSPDSLADLSSPAQYHNVNGHYSSAGRGYPHGGYMSAEVEVSDQQNLVDNEMCEQQVCPVSIVIEPETPKLNGSVPRCIISDATTTSDSSSDDDVDFEIMSDTPIQILTNEAYL